jgi:hypothetical protein
MERQPYAGIDASVAAPSRSGWRFVLLGLLIWQGWATLGLFGTDHPWDRLLDDQPIMSGRHPLHLYHGYLGARALLTRGTPCCYDPAFQAGYPKTPIFDGGSRPAELFLVLAGGGYYPWVYKVGLALCCIVVPIFLVIAARGIGLSAGSACLTAMLGLLVWWGRPCQDLVAAGDVHLLFAALAALAHVGLLIHFDRAPGLGPWLGLIVVDSLGWYAHPLLFAALIPLNLLYYLCVGTRHEELGWHLALMGALVSGLAINAFWLVDWVMYFWIRSPLPVGIPVLSQPTLETVWNAELWGSPADRSFAVLLLGSALLGLGILNQCKNRPAARVLGLAAAGMLALAVAGISSEPLGRLGTAKLLVPALWFAAIPAVVALVQSARLSSRLLFHHILWEPGKRWLQLGLGVALLCGLTVAHSHCPAAPLIVGLEPQRQALVDGLRAHTTPDARILLEGYPGQNPVCCWTALLPMLTDRPYLGGLDPRADFDYAFAGWEADDLAGRPLAEWSATELEQFCQRYNIGWVVCWSGAAVKRFRSWPAFAEPTMTLPADPGAGGPDEPGCLFTLRRSHSFILKGQARWLRADSERIVLGDVVPEDGQVVLSLHYQSGLRPSPTRVRLEREPELRDPIPFVRLRIPGPVTRVTLTWGDR